MRTRSVILIVLGCVVAGVVLAMALFAAFGMYQAVQPPCGDRDYPITSSEGGGACVPRGQPPPSGWTTYEPGHTPTRVDELGQSGK